MANKCRCGAQTIGGENRTVFCEGPLLDAVQRSNMFPCCKHFVDMSCIFTPTQTMADFDMFSNCRKNDGSLRFLQMFVEKHFNDPGTELEPWTPPDWKPQPSFLIKISDPEIKQFGSDVNKIWLHLGRRIKDDVKENPDQYSILYIPNPFIVPATDCREYRYWDSFWIIRGLLQCGMHQTARGMIDNFLVLVQQYGFVPGCGRIYCTGRSNPPLLIMMVKAYVEVTKDEKYAINSLPLLETEYETFISKHSIQVKGRTMYQYRDSSAGPRPEAYREDLMRVATIRDSVAREVLYTELKSASESGMDFSSRWVVSPNGSNQGSLADTKTSAIVPVELNAIVFRNGKILAELNRKAGNTKKADEYQDRACGLVKAIRDNLWNEQAGIWLDYDVANNKPRNYFCCTNFAPLWARAFPLVDTDKVSKGVMQYIKTNNLDQQYGGVPYTMNKEAGQKWDYPNVYPPMMFLVVEGLDNLGTPAAKAMSKRWAHRWVKSNYAAFKYESFMFEKYYCEEFGSSGGTSPENTPVGYGWTNGVVIEFLCKYGKEISLADDLDEGCKCKEGKSGGPRNGKNEYIITSEANMEDQPSKKCCLCGNPSTGTGVTVATANKSTGAMSGPYQQDDRCSCGIAQNQPSQQQQENGKCSCGAQAQQQQPNRQSQVQMQRSQPGADCSCGAGAHQQQQSQGKDCSHGAPSSASCGVCGSQKQQPSQAQMQRSQMQQTGADCACGAEAHMQQQAQMQRSQMQRSQHDPDCPCSGQQQPKGQSQMAGSIVFQGKKPSNDADCECSVDERQQQQMQQQQKQKECMQQQMQVQQEHQKREQELQREQEKEDCTTKPQPQDCSQHLKSQQAGQKQSEATCGCDVDEDEDQDQQKDQEHYFPVADKQADDCPDQEGSYPEKTGCDGFGQEDCPDTPEEDCGCTGKEKVQQAPIPECAQPKPQQYGATDDCSCSLGQGQGQGQGKADQSTFICPHCGGITSEPHFNHVSTQSVGTNRPTMAAVDGCDCSKEGGAPAGQQQRGMSSMGLHSGQNKAVASGPGGAQKPECGPCKLHMPEEYPAMPKPMFNKQFPLADPLSKIGTCPTDKGSEGAEGKNKKKCCNCDEKEKEQE